MTADDNQTEPLDGKTREEQINIASAALDAAKRGLLPLSDKERSAIVRFVELAKSAATIDDELLHSVNLAIRHHRQHIIALMRG